MDIGRSAAEILAIGAQIDKAKSESAKNYAVAEQTKSRTPLLLLQDQQALQKAINENYVLGRTLNQRVFEITRRSDKADFDAYVAQIEKSAAGLESVYIDAAKEWLKGRNVTELNNPYLQRVAQQAVAIEFQRHAADLKKAEAKWFGATNVAGGGATRNILQLIKMLADFAK